MNGTLPTPILQVVLNNSPRIFISWRYLGSNSLWALVKLFDNSGLIQTASSDPGSIFYDFVPNQPLNNPPYSIRLAATDGTNTGPDSVAIPVILYKPIIRELVYDTVNVGVTLKPPSPPQPAGTYYVMTVFKDGVGENSEPFLGLQGSGPLDHAPATANCSASVVANQDIPQGQFSCTTTGPSSVQVGIITQPATIVRVQFISESRVEVDATGPTSVGPPITGHRWVYGNEVCSSTQLKDLAATGVASNDFDGDSGVLELTAAIDPTQPTCLIAAGTSTSPETVSVGPYSTPLQIITEAPSFVSLMSTTAGALVANWTTVPPPPNDQIAYRLDLSRNGLLIDQQTTALLNFQFAVLFEAGGIYTLIVRAMTNDGRVIGPASAPAPGPFISNSPTVLYDSLGRLVSMSITGYRDLTYTLDSFGNITNAKVNNNNA